MTYRAANRSTPPVGGTGRAATRGNESHGERVRPEGNRRARRRSRDRPPHPASRPAGAAVARLATLRVSRLATRRRGRFGPRRASHVWQTNRDRCEPGGEDRTSYLSIKGSGEAQLLADPTFRNLLREVGVSPQERPVHSMGVDLGRRSRAIVTDSGRLDPSTFREPYRRFLRSRGRLSVRAFIRHYGQSPGAIATDVGMLVGHLDARLNEGADPSPQVACRDPLRVRHARPTDGTARRQDCRPRRRAQHAVPGWRSWMRGLPGELPVGRGRIRLTRC
jgi:hypothetical protein